MLPGAHRAPESVIVTAILQSGVPGLFSAKVPEVLPVPLDRDLRLGDVCGPIIA